MPTFLLVSHKHDPDRSDESWIFLQLSDFQGDRALASAYESLPDWMQLLILLSIYDRISDRDLAKMLGCDPEMIRWLLHAACNQMNTQLGRIVDQKEIVSMLDHVIRTFPVSPDLLARIKEHLLDLF